MWPACACLLRCLHHVVSGLFQVKISAHLSDQWRGPPLSRQTGRCCRSSYQPFDLRSLQPAESLLPLLTSVASTATDVELIWSRHPGLSQGQRQIFPGSSHDCFRSSIHMHFTITQVGIDWIERPTHLSAGSCHPTADKMDSQENP